MPGRKEMMPIGPPSLSQEARCLIAWLDAHIGDIVVASVPRWALIIGNRVWIKALGLASSGRLSADTRSA